MFKKIFLFTALISTLFSTAQEYPQNYFRSPLDIPLYLSGNFGELRSNHFHAGLDIKTQGVEGQKVYAVADGYVSRIKVSPYGYGNAIYVTHPNGYTSVYGHLKKYSDKIATYVKQAQYDREEFSVQLFPPASQFPLKKGDLIAYSGNSGGSGGPHLHFELRDTKSEHPYNPLFFGFNIQDNVRPNIYALTIYPLNDTSYINGSNKKKRFRASGVNGSYALRGNPSIQLFGQFGFGIESVDKMNGTGNTYGLHQISLSHNGESIFKQEISEFAFSEGRYINSYIDYDQYIRNRRRVQRSFVQDGNKLRIYKKISDQGKLILNDSKTHDFTYKVIDTYGNVSSLNFSISATSTKPNKQIPDLKPVQVRFFQYNQRNTFIEDEVLVDIPPNILYEDLYFEYRKEEATNKTISPIYWIHNHYTPLHSYMTVSIKLDEVIKNKSKALIGSTTDGYSFYPEGGRWNGNNISIRTRSFGGYAILMDTIAPQITPINIYANADMSNKWSISIKVKDNFAGIESFRATVDGKWILMEYDAKNNSLVHYFDEHITPGEHQFRLVVKDGVDNTATYETTFKR
ncbi:MAG: M23 family metallopeptidase [Vicingaceae bacterium]